MTHEMSESVTDDDVGGTLTVPSDTGYARPPARYSEGAYVSPEVKGDPAVPTVTAGFEAGAEATAGAHDEVQNTPGTEAGDDFAEASPEQLAAESGEESAVSDLVGIEGFSVPSAGESAEAAEAAEAGEIPEAGTALPDGGAAGSAEFAFLAGLIPTLISTVGPPLAKAVIGKLKPRTKARLARHARAVPKIIGRAAKAGQVVGTIAKLLKSAEAMPATESEGSVDESMVESTAMVLESIIGTDDRVRITPTTKVPWRMVCALRIHFPNGRTYRGTGFLIGRRAVATAGHCVYLRNEGGWARRIEVFPGADGSSFPYGQAVATQLRSVVGWVMQGKPASDYGCVVLPQGAFGGRNLGAFGFAAWSAGQLVAAPAVLGGYDGDKPFAQLWGMARKIKTVTADQVHYEIDTMGGKSGAPVYIKRNGQRVCVAIHNYGGATANSATRITPPVYQRLAAWRQL